MRADPGDVVEAPSPPSSPATIAEPIRTFFDLPLFATIARNGEQRLLPPPAPEKRPPSDALDMIRQRIAERTGHDQALVERVVRAFLVETTESLADTGSVDLRPLGSFRTVNKRERTGRHPRTGEPIRIPACRGVAFRVGKRLRERVHVPKDVARLLSERAAATSAPAPPPVLAPPPEPPPVKRGRIIGITSGKGGTGKTFLAANLAVALALSGQRVAAVDADLGLANLHLLLALQPTVTLGHVIFENASLPSAIQRGPGGVELVTGGAGATALADLKPAQLERLVSTVKTLRDGRDLVLVDTAAGLSPRTLRLMHESDLCLVATTPEVTAMTDAYAVLKTLSRTPEPRPHVALVVNQARSEAEGTKAHEKLRSVCDKFLGFSLELFAVVPEDAEVGRSVSRKTPLTLDPERHGPAADAVRALAKKIEAWAGADRRL